MAKLFTTALVIAAGLAASTAAYAEGGCGWGWHRGPLGGCRRNGEPAAVVPAPGVVVSTPGGGVIYAPVGRACPYGYHLGPQGRRCWPN